MTFLWTLFLRVAVVAGLIVSLPHYYENPIVITIFAFLCLGFVLILGDDQIDIYEDKVVLSTNSFASFIFKSKGKTYYINEIKKAYLPPTNISTVDFTLVMLVSMIGGRNSGNRNRPIYFEMINGKEERVGTCLEENKRKKIVQVVNSLVSVPAEPHF